VVTSPARLLLTERQCQQIINEAISGRPNEVCGLFIGRWRQAKAVVSMVIPLTNVSPTPRIHYQVDPKAFVAAYHEIERRSEELLAIYHSHPFGTAIPSTTDLAEAAWRDVFYVIVGFPDDILPDLRAWTFRLNVAAPVELSIIPN
jgi:proteasome lid subunit RPN8/RPN11